MALHGGLGSGPQLENQSELSTKADQEHFIVVYPEGVVSNFGIRTWNAGGCCGFAMDNNIDDVSFINQLLDTLIGRFLIDTTRIYVTGMSNGGFMAYRLACELSHRIAAIAPVACTMSFNCMPVLPVSIIHFHSYLDENIPWYGGIGNGISNHYNPPLDSVFNVWAGFNSCSINADTLYNGTDYDKMTWTGCACNTEIHYYITHDGGHSWPGGTATIIGDPVSQYISANNLMWEFFVQHPLCVSTSNDQAARHSQDIRIFPNPTTGIVNISNLYKKSKIFVFNACGKQLEIRINSGISSQNINLSNVTAGIYYLKIVSDSKVITTKIILTSTNTLSK